MSGPVLFRTETGYMKNGWCILTDIELYIYLSKDALSHHKMRLVLGSKVVGHPADPTQKSLNMIEIKMPNPEQSV